MANGSSFSCAAGRSHTAPIALDRLAMLPKQEASAPQQQQQRQTLLPTPRSSLPPLTPRKRQAQQRLPPGDAASHARLFIITYNFNVCLRLFHVRGSVQGTLASSRRPTGRPRCATGTASACLCGAQPCTAQSLHRWDGSARVLRQDSVSRLHGPLAQATDGGCG